MLHDQGENFPLIISMGVVQVLLPGQHTQSSDVKRTGCSRAMAEFWTQEFPFTWAVLPMFVGSVLIQAFLLF